MQEGDFYLGARHWLTRSGKELPVRHRHSWWVVDLSLGDLPFN